jgi:hypothetical protein
VAEYRGQTSNGGPASITKKSSGPNKSSSAGIPAASVHLGREIGSSAGPVDLSPGASAVRGGGGEKTVSVEISEEERKLLAKIEKEAELPPYDLFSAFCCLRRACLSKTDPRPRKLILGSRLCGDGHPVRLRRALEYLLAARCSYVLASSHRPSSSTLTRPPAGSLLARQQLL